MRFFALFLQRPVGTSLLCLALALAGALALRLLPRADAAAGGAGGPPPDFDDDIPF